MQVKGHPKQEEWHSLAEQVAAFPARSSHKYKLRGQKEAGANDGHSHSSQLTSPKVCIYTPDLLYCVWHRLCGQVWLGLGIIFKTCTMPDCLRW